MEEFHEKRKLDQNMSEQLNGSEKRQATDDNRALSMVNRNEEDIFSSATATTISMGCPPEKVGPLIGKKGVVVQEIMRRSQCRIYVDQNYPDGHPRQIQITGHPRDLGTAIALVTMVMEHGPSIISPVPAQPRESVGEGQDITDSDFVCPAVKVGALIGSKGSNVHEIFTRTGCKVQVLQDGVPDGMDRRVSFTGTSQQIQEAKMLVGQLITNGNFDNGVSNAAGRDTAFVNQTDGSSNSVPPNGPNMRQQETDINPEKVRLVIGARGVTIGEIMKRSGCKIFINQNFPEGQPHKVVFNGTPQQIDVAKYLIETVIQNGMSALYSILNGNESIVIQEINVYEHQVSRLLANDIVNEVQNRCFVKITVDSPNNSTGGYSTDSSNRISVIGKTENVHSAIKAIHQIVGSPIDPTPTEMEISTPHSTNAQAATHTYNPPVSSGPILALGKDGTSGHLESAYTLPDGTQQQVAEINNDVMGRIVGARSATISLIKAKSGSNLQVLKSDQSKGTTRLVLTGTPLTVSLAAQMVQEILVNGTGKLLKMADAVPLPMKGNGAVHIGGHENDHYFNGSHGVQQQSHPNAPNPFFGASAMPMYPSVTMSGQSGFPHYSNAGTSKRY